MTVETDTDTTPADVDKGDSTASIPDPAAADDAAKKGDDPEKDSGNAEAAAWRHKTREAETERDTARTQLTAQRAAIIAAAAEAKGVSAELVAKTVDIDDLIDDDGLLTPAAAAEAIDGVIKTYGLPDTRPDGSSGASRKGGDVTKSPPSWGTIAKGRTRTQW